MTGGPAGSLPTLHRTCIKIMTACRSIAPARALGIPATAVLAMSLAWVSGCGDGGTEPQPAPNRAPQALGSIPPQSVVEGESIQVNLVSSFSDPDGDVLTYSATSSDADIASVTVAGGTATVTGVAPGSTRVTAGATDPGGLAAEQGFPVTVEAAGRLLHEVFDSLMTDFTEGRGIAAAALGIMKDGDIVYDRAFGWKDQNLQAPLPVDAMMRLASVSKPITAAAIHELAADGMLDLNDFVFDLAQDEGGLLELAPFPALGDARLSRITVQHLLRHRGGWDRDVAGDLTYREIRIAEAMGIPSPPGRENTVRYILGQPLQLDPGSQRAYSNIGYLVLGLVIEEVSERDYMSYVLEEVFGPLGVPVGDIIQGRTFPRDRSDREPWYDDDRTAPNVFDPSGPRVRWPDGGWDHEARIAQGGLVASTRAILEFLDAYQVNGDDIGTRRSGSEGSGWRWNHTGSLPGTNTLARQRGDGINYVVLFNRRPPSGPSYSSEIRRMIDELLDNERIRWPAG